ncbi:hypothetical protein HOE37_02540 [Candidatus Woesearchaeota archaeon]|jgi:hypothetical protein|nr:hypothetical protein [Candidatus Woesearchaeota archaeon]MBT4110712.1 hypothetical protein [Candidatus Woesearchaeota archaeon]MBT4336308.1 hypothetical protein [Candidatus Woesearchaeota archaeon]MBT4469331.1 hypothetical protein [Candidatus Woesearchaeota archaeon]MBT6743846.1 hypothetical protein [Candidatus Woesearchaeota archaeon]
MAEELYVINTEVDSFFVNPFVNECLRTYAGAHREFVAKIQEALPSFNLPYLALFSNGLFYAPEMIRPASGDSGNINNLRIGLSGLVEELLEEGPGIKPITAIVEFSLEELYPEEMRQLGERYDLKRMIV